MANVDSPSFPSHAHYKELVDVFCFTAVSSLNSAFWFIYGTKYQFLYFLNFCWFISFWSIARYACLPAVTLLQCGFAFLQFSYIVANLNFERLLLLLGLILMLIGFMGILVVAIVICCLRKCYYDTHGISLVLEGIFINILHILCIVFVNGYTIFCEWCTKPASSVWQRSGIVLIVALGFFTMVCCIMRLVNRGQEYRRNRVRVFSMNDPREGA